eukprot:923164-Alexandrium_andersonii.AAC.1
MALVRVLARFMQPLMVPPGSARCSMHVRFVPPLRSGTSVNKASTLIFAVVDTMPHLFASLLLASFVRIVASGFSVAALHRCWCRR